MRAEEASVSPGRDTARRTGGGWRFWRALHKWAGLVALTWLAVLGATGWVLDHHDWRWTYQVSVPSSWASPAVNRLVRGTIMRQVQADPNQPGRLIGASERGLWSTTDDGATWTDMAWDGADGLPQTYDLVIAPLGGERRIWLGTDDGLWRLSDDGQRAQRVALAGEAVSSLSEGSHPGELIGLVAGHGLFRIDVSAPSRIAWTSLNEVDVAGLPTHVPMPTFALDLHVGTGLLPQPWSTIINDFGGIAFVVLSTTGLLFWAVPRVRRPASVKARQTALRWLFRGHGPVIGVLAVAPILYLSVTGIMVDHIEALLEHGRETMLPRAALPSIYHYEDLTAEIGDVIAYPGEPLRLTAATRLGIINSTDGGRSWTTERVFGDGDGTDASLTKLIRRGGVVFIGAGNVGQFYRRDGETSFTRLDVNGPALAITDAGFDGARWMIKMSRSIYAADSLDARFEDTKMPYPALSGTTAFLFLAAIHTGGTFHSEWKWVNDLVALLGIVLALTGPVVWWKRKWV